MSSSTCESGTFSLDTVSKADGSGYLETIRSAGVIVSMPIFYANRQSTANVEDVKYKYIPAMLVRYY
jgi:hypothetical protein